MNRALILLALVFLSLGISGCGSSTGPTYLVINRVLLVKPDGSGTNVIDHQWLITDSSQIQQLYQAIFHLPQGPFPGCPLAAERYHYDLDFYANGSQPVLASGLLPPPSCPYLSVSIKGKSGELRGASTRFLQLISQAIGGPLEPSPSGL